jgi:hypothetical protein
MKKYLTKGAATAFLVAAASTNIAMADVDMGLGFGVMGNYQFSGNRIKSFNGFDLKDTKSGNFVIGAGAEFVVGISEMFALSAGVFVDYATYEQEFKDVDEQSDLYIKLAKLVGINAEEVKQLSVLAAAPAAAPAAAAPAAAAPAAAAPAAAAPAAAAPAAPAAAAPAAAAPAAPAAAAAAPAAAAPEAVEEKLAEEAPVASDAKLQIRDVRVGFAPAVNFMISATDDISFIIKFGPNFVYHALKATLSEKEGDKSESTAYKAKYGSLDAQMGVGMQYKLPGDIAVLKMSLNYQTNNLVKFCGEKLATKKVGGEDKSNEEAELVFGESISQMIGISLGVNFLL